MMSELEFCLEQSAAGLHHLFDHDTIRRAFELETAGVKPEVAAATNQLIDDVRAVAQLDQRRARIVRAPADVQQVFARLYFTYLDRYLARRGVTVH